MMKSLNNNLHPNSNNTLDSQPPKQQLNQDYCLRTLLLLFKTHTFNNNSHLLLYLCSNKTTKHKDLYNLNSAREFPSEVESNIQ